MSRETEISVMSSLPPVEELIPHRGTLLLVDRVVAFNDSAADAEYAPRRDAWYADAEGNMPAWIGIEIMAQTVAAHVSLLKRQRGMPAKMGALLGTRSYRSAVSSFAAGQTLSIRAELVLSDPNGLGAYDCTIFQGQAPLAQAVLKVYEPEDFAAFVQGNLQ